MRHPKLGRSFYTEPTLDVAKDLLGKYIVRKWRGKILKGKIIETEAYIGPRDRASHSYLGKRTPRNEAEFLQGGHIYIYLVYGMHWQLNITTSKKDTPECVLIRALDLGNGNMKEANGPGKLCRYLRLDKSFNEEDVTKSKRIWLQDRPSYAPPSPRLRRAGKATEGEGEKVEPRQILATGRIGIDYAGPYWAKRKWRFLLKEYQKILPKK